jgi:hypothetical protein
MWRVALVTVAVALTSCATEVIGPYSKSLSADDIQQIKALVLQRSDIAKSIQYIHVTRPDCVVVETGHTLFEGVSVTFSACKRNGRWQINKDSVDQWRTVVTS